MTLPDNYASIACTAIITALMMGISMPIFQRIARKLFGSDPARDSFIWGLVVFGPLFTRLLDPLTATLFK